MAQDGANVTVPFTMVLGNDGADKVSVVMTDASGNTETKGYALEGEGGKVSFSPASSGEYTFTITASRENEQDKTGNTVKINFAYPLSAPSISSATSMGNGTVSLVWQSVKEATSYNVYVGGTKVGSTSATSYDVTGLTVGTKYDLQLKQLERHQLLYLISQQYLQQQQLKLSRYGDISYMVTVQASLIQHMKETLMKLVQLH